jgi:hypothetical protein
MRAGKVSQEGNAQAAWIILNAPDRYAGLPLLWAEAWVKQHGLAQLVRGCAGEARNERRPAGRAGRVEK